MSESNYLLEKDEFRSPLLYRIYEYLHSIYLSKNPVKLSVHFDEDQLKLMMDATKKCQTKHRASVFQRISNNIFKRENKKARLESLLKDYSNRVFGVEDLGEDIHEHPDAPVVYDEEHNIYYKNKELQMKEMNNLFCNLGNRIENRVKTLENIVWNRLDARLPAHSNVPGETFSKTHIQPYIDPNSEVDGGKKMSRKQRRRNRKTRKTRK